MGSINELQKNRIVDKIYEDIQMYRVYMNKHENVPIFPEKQIYDTIEGYVNKLECIDDFSITCKEGNITKDGVLDVTMDVRLKPETIIQYFK